MTQTERLLGEALSLPEPERAELAARLITSLSGPPDSGVDAAWAAEIERRCAALDSGEAVSSDWNEVRIATRTLSPRELFSSVAADHGDLSRQ